MILSMKSAEKCYDVSVNYQQRIEECCKELFVCKLLYEIGVADLFQRRKILKN